MKRPKTVQDLASAPELQPTHKLSRLSKTIERLPGKRKPTPSPDLTSRLRTRRST